MSSSMIGMKGFLVSQADYQTAVEIINSSDIDALARAGAMVHIFSAAELSSAQLNGILNESTGLAEFIEFVHRPLPGSCWCYKVPLVPYCWRLWQCSWELC